MSEISENSIGIIAHVEMGQSPSSSTCNTIGIGYPLLNGPTEFGFTHPNPVQYTTDPKRFAQKDDLLFCVRGSTTGRMNWADQNYAIGRGIAALRHKHGSEYQPFLRAAVEYRLSNLLSVASGSTFPNVSKDQILSQNIPLPPLPVQLEIAHILGSLDDKIELNRQMNATLESMARALFKSWFVDFDPVRAKAEGRQPDGMDAETAALFPDSFVDSELGEIPAGWGVIRLVNCCKRIENGGTPRRDNISYWENGDIPWLTSGEVRQAIIVSTQNFITLSGLMNSSAKLWQTGTTVIAMYGATAGEVTLLASEMSSNQACCGLIPTDEMRYYIYLAISSAKSNLASLARGSAQQNLSQQIIANYSLLVPNLGLLAKFDKVVDCIIQKWINNLHEMQILKTFRNAILPRLMTGEMVF